MANPTAESTIRSKKLGVLIRDARLATGRSAQECAEVLNCSSEMFESYETAKCSPSLPEIEALAYYLNIPLEHFWGNQSLQVGDGRKNPATMQRLIALRHIIIGA